MSALVVRGRADRLPLPDDSVDLIVTSPPYFGLRSYTDGGEHYAGQIGSEATPAEFLEALWACTAEWIRVLKPSGSIWVNLGDKYVADNRGSGGDRKRGAAKHAPTGPAGFVGREMARQKSLMGLPWRYALGCIDQLGLILRANVIWSKPNGLPESVTDRVRRSHEDWFHFTVLPRYFSAVDEIREPHTGGTHARRADGLMSPKEQATVDAGHRRGYFPEHTFNPLGKLPGSVWEIPSEPLTVPDHLGIDHFAAFPTEWPRRIIQGWSPPAICTECGEGKRPIIDRPGLSGGDNNPQSRDGSRARSTMDGGSREWRMRCASPDRISGYACGCRNGDAPTRPAVVLDPFGGTGTTALCASVLGRIGITVDLSHDYSRLAVWRTHDPASRAKAMRVEKPPIQIDGQADLFGGAA